MTCFLSLKWSRTHADPSIVVVRIGITLTDSLCRPFFHATSLQAANTCSLSAKCCVPCHTISVDLSVETYRKIPAWPLSPFHISITSSLGIFSAVIAAAKSKSLIRDVDKDRDVSCIIKIFDVKAKDVRCSQ